MAKILIAALIIVSVTLAHGLLEYCRYPEWPVSFQVSESGQPKVKCGEPPCHFRTESDFEKASVNRGVAIVRPNQIVLGGIVDTRNPSEYQKYFDYVSDVKYHNFLDGSFSYNVTIYRLSCPARRYTADPSIFGKKQFAVPSHLIADPLQRLHAEVTDRPTTAAPTRKEEPTTLPYAEYDDGQIDLDENDQYGPEVPDDRYVAPFKEPLSPEDSYAVPPPAENYIDPSGQPDPNQEHFFVSHQEQPAYGQVAPAANPNYYYYPVQSRGFGFYCFAADSVVTLSSGTSKRMDQLKVGDWVLASNAEDAGFAQVESWLHRSPSTLAEFHKITVSNGPVIKLTGKHYIFRGNCQNVDLAVSTSLALRDQVYAEELTENDCVFVHDDESETFVERRIESIEKVTGRGIYAPMTSTGNIIVNDVLASCYNVVDSPYFQESFADALEWYSSSLWGQLWSSDSDAGVVELPPGLSVLVDILRLVVPQKM